ncbi:MAG: TonB-dependent receptor plug domain-containing protein [Flavobacteriales bacterium]
MKNKIIFYFILFFQTLVFSQENAHFLFQIKNLPIVEVFSLIEEKFQVKFSYQDISVEKIHISIENQTLTLKELLQLIEKQTPLTFQQINKRYLIVLNKNFFNQNHQILEQVVINSYLTQGITKNKDATFTLKPEKLELLPGLIEADVIETIQQLPGVVSTNETATGFTVRGGHTDQNRVIWDGITMYHKGHLFGTISPFNPNASKRVVFYNKGTHPRFGERVSSVIDIYTSQKIPDKMKASLGFNGISADVFFETPVIKDKLSFQGSVRRSFAELFETPTLQSIEEKVFQHTKIIEIDHATKKFNFLDFHAKLNYQINKENSVHLSTIYIDNDLNVNTSSLLKQQSFNDQLSINNVGYSASWKVNWNENLSQKTSAFLSKYRFSYHFITEENEEQISDFEKQNVIFDSGISSEVLLKLNNQNSVNLGYQYSLKDVDYAFLETNDLSFVLDSDKNIINNHSLFINYSYKKNNTFNLDLGARASYYKELDNIRMEPRLMFYKPIFKQFGLQLSGEIKNQIISEIDETILSDLSLENSLWRLADGQTFPIINSKHTSLGFLFQSQGWTVDVDYYFKNINGITALSLGFLNPDDPNFHIGKQKNKGINVFVNKKFKNFSSWISYSISSSKNKFDGINNNKYFTANQQIKHLLNISLTYKYKNLQSALSWQWHTGKPYTESFLTNDGSLYFNTINNKTLENYHRLDASVTYQFKYKKSDGLKNKIGISIRNVYNRNNILSRDYTGNNSLNDAIKVIDKVGLGFTPNILFRLYW